MELKEKCRDLKVYFRLLPSLDIYRDYFKFNLQTNTIYLRCTKTVPQRERYVPSSSRFWCFQSEKVFYNSSQEEIYQAVTDGILEKSIASGNDAVILAFGQTGSGKTFTMSGIRSHFYQRGVVPRFMSNILESRNRSDIKINSDISFVEIIGQEVRDLFSGRKIALNELKRVPTVALKSNRCSLGKLFLAESRRKVADYTKLGNRGHAIITFHVRTLDLLASNAETQYVKIHFVDLAGVDSFGETQESGKQASDIGKSNITKSFLDQCICHLEKPPVHVVSDLVIRFLGKSLSNNSTLRFIGHLKMSKADRNVTLSLLRFGGRIKGIKEDKLTADPSLPGGKSKLDSLNSLVVQLQLEAMLEGYSDFQAMEKHLCKERTSLLQAKAHEFVEHDSEEEEMVVKDERENLDVHAESHEDFNSPFRTLIDFENDPQFNYHGASLDVLPSQHGSHGQFKSQNELHAQITSRSRLESRSRSEASEVHIEMLYETDSLLHDLISLNVAKEVAVKLEQDSKPQKEEVLQLFENKLERERQAFDQLTILPTISKSGTVATRKSAAKAVSSQPIVKKSSSRKSIKSAGSGTELEGKFSSDDLLPDTYLEGPSLPISRDIDDHGITIGPAVPYPYHGRMTVLIKRSRTMETNRYNVLHKQLEVEEKNNTVKQVVDVDLSESLVCRRQKIPIVPTPSLDLTHKEEETTASRHLQKELDSATLEASQTRSRYFEATRKLEWCRYQWARANCDLQEVQEKRRTLGGEQYDNQGHIVTNNREVRLADFIKGKRFEFHEVQQDLIARRNALNKAMILVDQAQRNLDEVVNKEDIRRPETTESIDCSDEDLNTDEPQKLSLYKALQKHY